MSEDLKPCRYEPIVLSGERPGACLHPAWSMVDSYCN